MSGLIAACDHPTGPAAEIAGEYELTARVENAVATPVTAGDEGATLVLRTDRTWLLTRHRGRVATFEGFGLTDRYSFDTVGPSHALTMFSEGPFLGWVAGSATVSGDTLRWGGEIFVRR
jgi:hypothetical protein